MLGIDITRISRFDKDVKDTFINKVLHLEEIKEYESSKNKAKFLAARWAIKEALFKADNKYSDFSKVNITKEERVYKFPGFVISTSTEDDYYIAKVIKEK